MHDLDVTTKKREQRILPSPRPENPAYVTLRDEPMPPLDCGEFRTKWVRDWHPELVTAGELYFKHKSCHPRTVVLGLNEVDVDILRVRADLCSVADDRAIINMAVWPDTQHFGSGCSWLSIPPSDPDIQTGSYNTQQDRQDDASEQSTSRRITFARKYIVQPNVIVWLTAVNFAPGKNPRVRAWVDDVTREGFTLHVATWGDTDTWYAGTSWLAYSSVRSDVRSGTFALTDVRLSGPPAQKNRGRVSWGPPSMTNPPRVFVALNALDFEEGPFPRLSLYTSDITTTGMNWSLDTWGDTICYHSGGVYFVFEETEF